MSEFLLSVAAGFAVTLLFFRLREPGGIRLLGYYVALDYVRPCTWCGQEVAMHDLQKNNGLCPHCGSPLSEDR